MTVGHTEEPANYVAVASEPSIDQHAVSVDEAVKAHQPEITAPEVLASNDVTPSSSEAEILSEQIVELEQDSEKKTLKIEDDASSAEALSNEEPNNEELTREGSNEEHSSKDDLNKDISSKSGQSEAGWNADVVALGLTGMTLNFMLNSVAVKNIPTISVYVESGHFRLFNDNHEKKYAMLCLIFTLTVIMLSFMRV